MIKDTHFQRPDETVETQILSAFFENRMDNLHRLERKVLLLRFGWKTGGPMARSELMSLLNLPVETIKELEQSGLTKLVRKSQKRKDLNK